MSRCLFGMGLEGGAWQEVGYGHLRRRCVSLLKGPHELNGALDTVCLPLSLTRQTPSVLPTALFSPLFSYSPTTLCSSTSLCLLLPAFYTCTASFPHLTSSSPATSLHLTSFFCPLTCLLLPFSSPYFILTCYSHSP